MSDGLRVDLFGDAAVLVRVDSGDLPARAARAAAVAAGLASRLATDDGWGVPIPGIGGVLVPFDPLRLDPEDAADALRWALESAGPGSAPRPAGRTVQIPVRYGGQWGPDLDEVAAEAGIAPAEVTELHAAARYRVLVLGFLPGFAYLGPLPPSLAAIGRRAVPRGRVAAGSVAIAAGLTGVYPVESPGGWHVIGRTDAVLWEPAADPPNRLSPEDEVRFIPVDSAD